MRSEIAVHEVNPVVRIAEIKNQEIAEIIEYNERKKSPFRKWIQMNNDEHAYEAEDWLVSNSPTAYRILRFLLANMDNYNAVICSYKVLQEKLKISKPTVERAIRILKEHNYVGIVKSGTSNVYIINKHLYWNSWGTNYAYAEFDAKVIITASEQDDDIQNKIKTEIKRRQEVIQSPPTFREQIQQIQQNEKIN